MCSEGGFRFVSWQAADEIAGIRAALPAYCRLDTLAMVKVLEKLYEICG
jgi:hypothetical protein